MARALNNDTLALSRDLFALDNAKRMSPREVAATFVDTPDFWSLLSAKNHIVLGPRGSGKTVLAKMLSHEHLSLLQNKKAEELVATRSVIGTYVSTSLDWVGGLKNKPWLSDGEREELFQWRLNLACCHAFLSTASSCLNTYSADAGVARRTELDIVTELKRVLKFDDIPARTIHTLRRHLEDVELSKSEQLVRERAVGRLRPDEEPVGTIFSTPLFGTLNRAMGIVGDALRFPPETIWLLCLDEAEYLSDDQLRILNSHFRAGLHGIMFKMTTMPYSHRTLETNIGVPLVVGHDVEYVRIDRDPITQTGDTGGWAQDFANKLLSRRALVSGAQYANVSLPNLCGESELLDPSNDDWTRGSKNYELLKAHADARTFARADKLLKARSNTRFGNEIARKINGALLLRAKVAALKGRAELDAYSGATMVVRCSDGNPRRLVRLLNALLLAAPLKRAKTSRKGMVVRAPQKLARKEQTRVLLAFSKSVINGIKPEDGMGAQLVDLVMAIGNSLHHELHDRPLSTDQFTSFVIGTRTTAAQWKLIERGVELSLFNVNTVRGPAESKQPYPFRDGTFHLAFALAPYFSLLPRRGRPRSLTTLLGSAVGPKKKSKRPG